MTRRLFSYLNESTQQFQFLLVKLGLKSLTIPDHMIAVCQCIHLRFVTESIMYSFLMAPYESSKLGFSFLLDRSFVRLEDF